MKARRILLVSNEADLVGGGEHSLLLLLEGLAGREGWRPVLAVPGHGEMADRADALGIPVVEVALPSVRRTPWRLPGAMRESKRQIVQTGTQLVHANGARAMLIAGRAARALRIPVVWHVRVEGSDRLDGWLGRKAGVIIVPSRTVGMRFSGRDVRVVHNPVRVQEPSDPAEDRALRARLCPEKTLLFLSAAQLGPHKGQLLLLEALAGAEAIGPWHLVLAGEPDPGSPDYDRILLEGARRMGVSDRLTLLGRRDDVPALMRISDLFLHAPTHEGFGRVYVEAMAAGVPAVVAPVGGLVEIHELTRYGWMARASSPEALAATVRSAVADTEARDRCRAEGPRLAEQHFSIRTHADAVVAVYEGLMEGSG